MMILKLMSYWFLVSLIVTPTICAILFGGTGWIGILKAIERSLDVRKAVMTTALLTMTLVS